MIMPSSEENFISSFLICMEIFLALLQWLGPLVQYWKNTLKMGVLAFSLLS